MHLEFLNKRLWQKKKINKIISNFTSLNMQLKDVLQLVKRHSHKILFYFISLHFEYTKSNNLQQNFKLQLTSVWFTYMQTKFQQTNISEFTSVLLQLTTHTLKYN